MDWPGAQEMSKRFAKTIDPKIMSDDDKSPELQAAEMQMQAMGQEMQQMQTMLENVGKSIEMQEQRRKDYEAEIKAYQAETQRISATQAGMNEQQIQDIAMGVVAAAMESNGQLNGIPDMPGQQMDVGMDGMPEAPQPMEPMPPMEMPQ
jgi:hypothetical protein